MSDKLDYMEVWKPKAEREDVFPLVDQTMYRPKLFDLTKLQQNIIDLQEYQPKIINLKLYKPKVEEDDNLTARISRYLPPSLIIPPIVVRNVRSIGAKAPQPLAQPEKRRNLSSGNVILNAIRMFSRKTKNSPYWQDSGWERRGKHLIGHYKAGESAYAGAIEISDSVVQPLTFYIYDPPVAILTGRHSACFIHKGVVKEKAKYFVHFSEVPDDIDSGIIQIQRDLNEAIGA